MIYALIACGYVLIYRVSRVLNLAHGELMMLGSYLLLTTAWLLAANPFIAIACSVALSLTVGILVYVLLMRKMTGEMVLAAVLTTVALGILLRGGMVLIWSGQQQYPGQALNFSNPALALPFGARISTFAALLVATTVLVYAALFVFLRFGRWGVRMRAAGQNPLLAAQRGISTARHQSPRGLRAGLESFHADRIACRHVDLARFRSEPVDGNHRPQGISGRFGGRP